MKKSLALSMVLLSLVSCGKKGSGDSSNKPAPTVEPVVMGEVQDYTITKGRVVDIKDDMSNFEEYKAAMNQFKLIFKTKAGHNKHHVAKCRVDRKEYSAAFDALGEKAEIVIDIDKAGNSFVGADCEVGSWSKRQFLVYKTVFVTGTKKVEDILPYQGSYYDPENRLYSLVLDKGANLIVDDYHSIDDTFHEVISNNGRISSAKKENKYISHGGSVKIKTDKILGKLEIKLSGSNGTATWNSQGEYVEIASQGGRSGRIQIEATKSKNFQLEASVKAGNGTEPDKDGTLESLKVFLYDREYVYNSNDDDYQYRKEHNVSIY